jgi:hypothetical protein
MLISKEGTSKLPQKEGKGHQPPFWEGQRLDLSSKEVLCADPGAAEGSLGGQWKMKGFVAAL